MIITEDRILYLDKDFSSTKQLFETTNCLDRKFSDIPINLKGLYITDISLNTINFNQKTRGMIGRDDLVLYFIYIFPNQFFSLIFNNEADSVIFKLKYKL